MGLLAVALLTLSAGTSVFAENALQVPEITARSVFAFDPDTGEIIMDLNADERLPIGSVTKVATALVVLDHAGLAEEITIEGTDMVEPGFSAMGLQPGDTLTVEQLLTGLLVASGGDAALALARHVGADLSGSDDPEAAVAAFVDAMNATGSDLQLTNTQFANPDGDDSTDAWSTARDVALLYAYLEANETLAGISALTEYSFTSVGPEQTPYAGISTNQLAGQYDLLSAKTGSTQEAGGCLVLARTNQGTGGKEIVAILGSELTYDDAWNATTDERWNDATAVMEAIDTGWTPGQNLVADVATEPPASESLAGSGPVTNARSAPQAIAVSAEPVAKAASRSTEPLLVVTVAGGVLAFASVFAWSRISQPRT
jgi:D-alanyl-D-alanine carboxypeptidase (penicillin-binding protein 5/6)